VPDEVRAVRRGGRSTRRPPRRRGASAARPGRGRPRARRELDAAWSGALPDGWERAARLRPATAPIATRAASGKVLNALAPACRAGRRLGRPRALEQHARSRTAALSRHPGGRNLHFGVREHAMGAILNGLALHGGCALRRHLPRLLDYMRPAIRLAALMELPVIYVFTHDSIGVGEDGPTHQPVEHLLSLRAIPGLVVLRPADANETAEPGGRAQHRDGPTALA
jgi:transketolase